MANVYDYGDGFRVEATFTVDSVNTDPTAVVFKTLNPSGTITTYTYGVDPEIVKDATGIYYMDIYCNASGDWWWRVEGTGACIAAEEQPFVVSSSQFE